MSSHHLQLKLKQSQQLSQGLQQSLRVLQMSGIEIEREVEDWLEDNPLLERQELPENSGYELHSHNADITRKSISLDDDDNAATWENLSSAETLHSYLHKQVCEHPLSEREAACVHVLIDFLDEQGYLTDTLEEVIDNTPLEWLLDEGEMEIALEHLQQFDPPGIATANLSQSLLHQLDRLPIGNARRAAALIIANHLNQISQNLPKSLIKLTKLLPEFSEEQLREALEIIGSLNPYPAYGFADSEPTAYVRPDVYVEKGKDGWQVIGNEAAWPQIRLNTELSEALQEEEALDPVWREKIFAAKQKLEMLQQRKATIIRVAEYIVANQQDFFMFGEIGIVPMLLKNCANELKLAESTISRAVNNKYLACPQGLFPLRYFFSQNAVNHNSTGEGISANAIKSLISQLVANEDKKRPLSDFALHGLLQQQGIHIARRTVAKYREQLGLPAVQQRRKP